MDSEQRTLGWFLAGLALVGLSGLSIACAWLAYSSGDVSGLQYMFLYFGMYLAVAAAVGTAVLCAKRVLPAVSLLPPVLAVLLNAVPQISGLGYNSSLIDAPGRAAAVVLLVLQLSTALYEVWWYRRSRVVAA
jgi:hypothetical protein